MRFLVDAQLPPALTRLHEAGHEAEHVSEIGLGDASDRALWQYALDKGAVIVTKDEDFSNMVARGGAAPPVIWIRVGNTRRLALLEWFTPLVEQVVDLIDHGQRMIELR